MNSIQDYIITEKNPNLAYNTSEINKRLIILLFYILLHFCYYHYQFILIFSGKKVKYFIRIGIKRCKVISVN